MISPPSGTRIYVSCTPSDMRKGMHGLSGEVSNVLRLDPYSKHLFVFRSRRGDYVKMLYWDGSGMCLFAKRLERGRFVWPPIVDGCMDLSPAQLSILLEGMDWRRTIQPELPRRPVFV